jgi:hypothetical protein
MAQSQPKTACFVFIYGWYKQVTGNSMTTVLTSNDNN